MVRSFFRDPSIDQKNDATSINNRRGMAHRAKRHSAKRDRQLLREDTDNKVLEFRSWLESTGKLEYQGQCDRLRRAGHEQDWHEMIRCAESVPMQELMSKVNMTPLLDEEETPDEWLRSASGATAFRSVWAGRPCYYIDTPGGFEFIFA